MKVRLYIVLVFSVFVVASSFGQEVKDEPDHIPDVSVRFSTHPRGATVFCSTMPVGKRFLGRADKHRTILLPQGRHQFIFSKPGYRLERKILDMKKSEVHYHIRLCKVRQPAKLRPFTLKIQYIGGDHWQRTAMIEYKQEEYAVEKGWTSPDGAFEVMEIRSDRMKIRHLRDGNVYWFMDR